MERGGALVHAGVDRGHTFVCDLVFELRDIPGRLQLRDGTLQAQGFFRQLIFGGFGLLAGLPRISLGQVRFGTL